MKLTKRILAFLLCLSMLAGLLLTASAVEEPAPASLTLTNTVASPGQTVYLTLAIVNNPGIAAINLRPVYDKEIFAVDTALAKVNSAFTTVSLAGNFVLSNDGTSDVEGDIVIVEIPFTVAENAPAGTYTVTVDHVTCKNYAEETVPVTVTAGSIQVSDKAYTPLEELTYTLSGNEMTITGFIGNGAIMELAPVYTVGEIDYTVTGIASEAVMENDKLTSVTLPETVEHIGEAAFYDCLNLTSFTILGNPSMDAVAVGYYYKSRKDQVVEGFVLKGWSGDASVTSKVQKYAAENGITFQGLEDLSYKGCQVSTDIATAETYSIRFVGLLNTLNYAAIGFRVTVENPTKAWESNSDKVYLALNETIRGTGLNGLPEGETSVRKITAEELGGKYMTAMAVRGIPGDADVTFTVVPYVINPLGARVEGAACTVKVTAEGVVTQNAA